jgi:CBS domain containing-hemolysin-like protein
MVPRVDLIGIEATQLADRLLDVALSAKVHFILVYRGSLDNIEALVDVRKYLLDPDHRIESARTAPAFVPASCPLSRLLAQFQREHKRIAVVVDEYGGTAGLVTRGDILEQIAGDVYEEMGKPRPVFQQAGPERWIVDAGFSLDELNRKLRLRLQGAETNRLSGWIVERAGRIPAANEVIEAQGCRITVLKTAKTRVTLAQIEKVEGAA